MRGGVSLWTPTDDDPDNASQGAWFLERVGDAVEPALSIEPPAAGWVYAGWVQTQGWYLPMGSFTAAEGADSDCFFCGPEGDVTLPGEDFVANLPPEIDDEVDLADGDSRVVISISPGPYDISPGPYDISPGPYDINEAPPFRFALDVLSVDLGAGQAGGELVSMNDSLVAPSASLTGP